MRYLSGILGLGILSAAGIVLAQNPSGNFVRGINSYSQSFEVPQTYTEFYIFLKFGKGAKPILNTFKVNGIKVKPKLYRDYYVIKLNKWISGKLRIEGKIFVRNPKEVKPAAAVVALCAKNTYRKATDERLLKTVLLTYPLPRKEQLLAEVNDISYGILYPEERELSTASGYTDITVAVPPNGKYELLLNGEEISDAFKAGEVRDRQRGFTLAFYKAIPLHKGLNEFQLKVNGKVIDTKKVYYSSTYSDIGLKVYPQPVADGKTPTYLILEALDENGKPVKVNGEIKVTSGDNLQYWDTYAEAYKPLRDVRLKLVNGRAAIKLKPLATGGIRRIKVEYNGLEKEFDIAFKAKSRPWIVAGLVNTNIAFSHASSRKEKFGNMPADLSKDAKPFVEGRAALFAKGTYKDYLITFRYDTRNPYDELMESDNPSAEGGPFYPEYGDESQQYFDARSAENLYLRIERNLSYLMYGDYNTALGRGLLFNTYRRTFTGGVLNLEEKDNYLLRGFVSRVRRDLVKDEIRGRGLSGPYYLSEDIEPYSEKVWIEVRDRYNPNLVLERRELQRFTDYEINYDLRYIIFKQPVEEWDKNFNPVYVVVLYETPKVHSRKYIYGLRAEKEIGFVRLGLSGVQEERSLGKYRLYGTDVKVERGNLKFVAEAVRSDGINPSSGNYTEGNAYRIELKSEDPAKRVRVYYKHVENGFVNPSTTTAGGGWYETYGGSYMQKFGNDTSVNIEASSDQHSEFDRKTVSAEIVKRLSASFSITGGARWSEEKSASYDTDYAQGILGFTYQPDDRLTLHIRREQTFKSSKSDIYPTRTIVNANYRINEYLKSYIQTEYREVSDSDRMLLSGGLEASKNIDNTYVYAKQRFNYQSLDWRTQSVVGLKHLFEISEKWSVDVGTEGVYSFIGAKDSDYVAFRVRSMYRDRLTKRVITGSLETRFQHSAPNFLATLQGRTPLDNGWTFLFRNRLFRSTYTDNILFLGFAYRPLYNSKWNWLGKLLWKYNNQDGETYKYISSIHGNYNPDGDTQLMGQIAAKYVKTSDAGDSFTGLLRGRFVKFIAKRFYVDAHAGILYQFSSKTYNWGWGPEIGIIPHKNLRLGFGYNFQGFHDRDFENADIWVEGVYFRLTWKIDGGW